MARIEFTDAQRKAIDFEGGDLLISAAAGSGKTATITEKIVKLVTEHKCSIDEMLIVTFTKSAAAEMKTRIRKRMSEERNEKIYKSKSEYKYLSEQILKLENAEICTIDSFLYRNLRPYFPGIGVSVEVKIGSDEEINELKEEAMRTIIDKKFKANDENWINLCDIISQTRDTSRIDKELLDLADKIETRGCEPAFFNSGNVIYKDDSDIIYGWIREYIERIVIHYYNSFIHIRDVITTEHEVYKKYGKALEDDILVCERIKKQCNKRSKITELKDYIESLKYTKLGMLKNEEKTETAELYQEIRKDFKEDIKDIKEKFLKYSEDEISYEAGNSLELCNEIMYVIQRYNDELNNKKITLGIIGYYDLEKYASKVLGDDVVAQEIGNRYKYIFVDEYQDTNQIQDKIFEKISRKSKRILVGDVKQSIYRFRGSVPYIFNKYRTEWNLIDEFESNVSVKNNYTLIMNSNFRSSTEILEFANRVSDKTFAMSDIDYTTQDKLIHARIENIDRKVPVEIKLVRKKKTSDENAKKVNQEADFAGKIAAELIGTYSERLARNVRAGDIAIIMRSPSSHADEYRDELTRRGIKSKLRQKQRLADFSSVKLIICLLEVIKNPLDEIYLSGALYSPLFNFGIDEIKETRSNNKDVPLFYVLNDTAGNKENINDEDILVKVKCIKFITWLHEQQEIVRDVEIEKYVESLINSNREVLTSNVDFDTNESAALNRFIEITREFSHEKENNSLNEFLVYAEKFIEKAENEEIDGLSHEDEVSIISIHSSKGLEYPIVILAESNRKRSIQDEIRPILLDKDWGVAMKIPVKNGLSINDTIFRKAFAEKETQESIYEEMRMLYVAMTRAREKLIITALVENPEKELTKGIKNEFYWDEWSAIRNSTYLEWILVSLHNIEQNNYQIEIVENESAETEICEVSHKNEIELETKESDFINAILRENNIKLTYLSLPSKISASELTDDYFDKYLKKCQVYEDNNEQIASDDFIYPRFITGANEYTAADKGIAMHQFLQFMSVENLKKYGARAEIERLIHERMISAKFAELININQINKFMQSELYKKMSEASCIKREFRFNVNLPASDYCVGKELKQELNNMLITVQGVVDCVLRDRESGKLELIDYKTDSLTREEYADKEHAYKKLTSRHESQLRVYKRICSDIFNEEISKMYIYSTVLGELIEVK